MLCKDMDFRPKKKKKAFSINIKNMGVDIDKNEYRTISESDTNYPEKYIKGGHNAGN